MTGPIPKSTTEINKMRRAGQLVAEVLMEVEQCITPGISTYDLNRIAHDLINKLEAEPLFLGHPNPIYENAFPAVICTSVNDAVVHGIPNKIPLSNGDIVGIDCGLRIDGYCGDSALTVKVGNVSDEISTLLTDCQKSLYSGIEQMQPGNSLRDVCKAIQNYADKRNYGIVQGFTGHGIGQEMHEMPFIPNTLNNCIHNVDFPLQVGYVFALEPMINIGKHDIEVNKDDGWTVFTSDGSMSAHFEHTVAITEDGPEILTKRSNESVRD